MTRNVGRIDQYVRIIIDLALIAYIVKDRLLGAGWPIIGAVGMVLIATAFFAYCPLYMLLGINTVHRSSSV